MYMNGLVQQNHPNKRWSGYEEGLKPPLKLIIMTHALLQPAISLLKQSKYKYMHMVRWRESN